MHKSIIMSKSSIVDVLLANIQTDQNFLEEVETKMNVLKEEKQNIVNRLKEQQKDLSILSKYADEDQQEKIKALGFEPVETQRGLNTIAETAFDLILKAKENQMTNGDWYEGYVKSLSKTEEAVTYSAFNIKCRSLFNTQKLLRKKGKDPKSSREDIISINGRVRPAAKKDKQDNKEVATASKPKQKDVKSKTTQ